MARPSIRAVPLLALALLAAAGCESSTPTLPLPPPSALVEAPPDAEGMVTVRLSGLEPRALVFAYNERTEEGVIGRADAMGEATLRIAAQVGDVIQVWQRSEDRRSAPRALVVPGGGDGGPADGG